MSEIQDFSDDITPVLEARAAALSRSSQDDELTGETIGVVVLVVGDERYGVEVQDVQEIEPLGKVTPIPGTPAFWTGVVNLRGSMYPVLDIERYLGLAASAEVENPKVALVSGGGLSVGLLVDEVAEVLGLHPDTVTREWARAKAFLRRELMRG